MQIQIKKAQLPEVKQVVKFIDSTFTVEGYGFVTSAQIETEIRRKAVWIAVDGGKIVGVRVGISRVYNLAVHKDYRMMGVGRKLMEIHPPDYIRVKSDPVGNLSKEQIDNFKSPEEFYQKLGFKFLRTDFARNFWQRGNKKAHFHKEGKKKHIKIYKNLDPKQKELFDEDTH